ncbi:50S ribosomal protein L35 [Patulibacter americanus]|jgi:large subunit ribosomal protein L35|uniref:50S ribosomal protein L35 n=1 Tax=Patulibacter americanus TaxID=588672 RepID=UPI0003B2FFC6|nr:50S ribosomal protein L35 [Patulibacter americanus]
MPKQKTHSGAKKRFKATGSGKIKARHAMSSHILGKKSPKRKRKFATAAILSEADTARAKRLLGDR